MRVNYPRSRRRGDWSIGVLEYWFGSVIHFNFLGTPSTLLRACLCAFARDAHSFTLARLREREGVRVAPSTRETEIRISKEAPRTETNRSQINSKPTKIQNAESKLKLFGILCIFEHLNLLRITDYGLRISNFVLRIFCSWRSFGVAQGMLCARHSGDKQMKPHPVFVLRFSMIRAPRPDGCSG
jgi:hypothetical protein